MPEKRVGIHYMSALAPSVRVTPETLLQARSLRNGTHIDTTTPEGQKVMKDGVERLTDGLLVNGFRWDGYAENNRTAMATLLRNFVVDAHADEEKKERLEKSPIVAIKGYSESMLGVAGGDDVEAVGVASWLLLRENFERYYETVLTFTRAVVSTTVLACKPAGDVWEGIRDMLYTSPNVSAISMGGDISVYLDAEETQGTSRSLQWHVSNPGLLEELDRNYQSDYNSAHRDWAKVGGPIPEFDSFQTQIDYTYANSKVFRPLERHIVSHPRVFLVGHRPTGKTFLYPLGFEFVHVLKLQDPELYERLQKFPDIGKDPMKAIFGRMHAEGKIPASWVAMPSFERLLDIKFAEFDGEAEELGTYLEHDADIKSVWNWTKDLVKNPMVKPLFEAHLKRLHIYNWLLPASKIGNAYAGSTPSNVQMVISNSPDLWISHSEQQPARGIVLFYGSAFASKGMVVDIVATAESVSRNIRWYTPKASEIGAEQYLQLHKWHVDGGVASISARGIDLLNMQKGLAELQPNIVYQKSIGKKGTGKYVFVRNDGALEPIKPKFISEGSVSAMREVEAMLRVEGVIGRR